MQGKREGVGVGGTGQISGYYPAASLINQSSLCSGTVDNTKGDANAIEHLERKEGGGVGGVGGTQKKEKKIESLVFEIFTIRTFKKKYLISVISAFPPTVITLVIIQSLVSDVSVVFPILHKNSSRYSPEVMGNQKIPCN